MALGLVMRFWAENAKNNCGPDNRNQISGFFSMARVESEQIIPRIAAAHRAGFQPSAGHGNSGFAFVSKKAKTKNEREGTRGNARNTTMSGSNSGE